MTFISVPSFLSPIMVRLLAYVANCNTGKFLAQCLTKECHSVFPSGVCLWTRCRPGGLCGGHSCFSQTFLDSSSEHDAVALSASLKVRVDFLTWFDQWNVTGSNRHSSWWAVSQGPSPTLPQGCALVLGLLIWLLSSLGIHWNLGPQRGDSEPILFLSELLRGKYHVSLE